MTIVLKRHDWGDEDGISYVLEDDECSNRFDMEFSVSMTYDELLQARDLIDEMIKSEKDAQKRSCPSN